MTLNVEEALKSVMNIRKGFFLHVDKKMIVYKIY